MKGRREFLQAASTITAAGLAGEFINSNLEAAQEEMLFTGTSIKQDFQEALQDAIRKASAELPCCDRFLVYEVRSIKGRVGGIGGITELNVTIAARFE
jgi:flavin-binding protein dodecin